MKTFIAFLVTILILFGLVVALLFVSLRLPLVLDTYNYIQVRSQMEQFEEPVNYTVVNAQGLFMRMHPSILIGDSSYNKLAPSSTVTVIGLLGNEGYTWGRLAGNLWMAIENKRSGEVYAVAENT